MLAYSRTEIHNDDVVPHRATLLARAQDISAATNYHCNCKLYYLCLCVYDECNL